MLCSVGRKTAGSVTVTAKALSLLGLLALAVSLLGLSPDAAWADGEEAVDVEYSIIEPDALQIVGAGDTVDPRDELYVDVTFGTDIGESIEAVDSGAVGTTPYVKGTLSLRPKNGGGDIVVLTGTSAKDSGVDRLQSGWTYDADDNRLSMLIASFTLPSGIEEGEYSLVMALQFKKSSWNTVASPVGWTEVRNYVSRSTVTVKSASGARPAFDKKNLKTAVIGQAYSAQLSATPSAVGNTIKWYCGHWTDWDEVTEIASQGKSHLEPYGLALDENTGSITGKVVSKYSQTVDFHVTAIECDSAGKEVGRTSRKLNVYLSEQPGITEPSVLFSRSAGGIVPGSTASVQMRLTNNCDNESADISFAYTDASGEALTYDTSIPRSDQDSRVYAGDVAIPGDAASIQSVTFDAGYRRRAALKFFSVLISRSNTSTTSRRFFFIYSATQSSSSWGWLASASVSVKKQ